MRGIARTAVVAGTATAVSGRVARRQQGRWAAKEQAAAPPDQSQPVYAPAAQEPQAQGMDMDTDMDTKLAQLKDLGALKEQGVLTDAEFAVQKDKILHPS
ncbi:MAG: SHOCT domain-containing protein [Dermatophilaceae bacterium]